MKHTRYIPDCFFVSRFFIKILYKNVSRETLYSQMSFRSQKMFDVKQLYIDIDFTESISTYRFIRLNILSLSIQDDRFP